MFVFLKVYNKKYILILIINIQSIIINRLIIFYNELFIKLMLYQLLLIFIYIILILLLKNMY